MKAPIERHPEALVWMLACLAVLLILTGIAVATATPVPTTPVHTHMKENQ